MIKNLHPGLFIAFEGLDGSGSKTQASLLTNVLAKEGYRVYLTKEPTNNLIGGLIKGQLLGEWQSDAETLQLLFAADRSQHLEKEIIPKLEAGRIVISDRYAFSSIAYGSVEIEKIKWLEEVNDQFILPDITFLINMRPKICVIRTKESRLGLELYREEQKLAKIWVSYEKLAKDYPNFHIIDGERDEMEIVREIAEITKKVLEKR